MRETAQLDHLWGNLSLMLPPSPAYIRHTPNFPLPRSQRHSQ